MMVGAENPLRVQSRVVGALILRNMRSRFGGTYYGFLIAILWPLSHLALIVGIRMVLPRASPAGESEILFYVTGIVAYITFLYTSRNITNTLQLNKPLLYFPAVRVPDIVISCLIVEIGTSLVVTILAMAAMLTGGVDIVPQDPVMALGGYASVILLGISVGVFNNAMAIAIPHYFIIYILVTIGLYIASGIIFVMELVPEKYRYWLLFNPLAHCIEWIRAGYYIGYGATTLSERYVLGFSLVAMTLGLALERAIGGRAVR